MTSPRPRLTTHPYFLPATVMFLVLFCPVCIGCGWWNQSPAFVWSQFRDDREYPRIDDALHITKGDGDLEEDLLPHFMVILPCDVRNLRYGEWEDYGSAGWLALRFDTSPKCLNDFLRDNGLHLTRDPFPTHHVPVEYEWHLNPSNTTYTGQPANRIDLAVSVEDSSQRPVVYVFSMHS